MKAHSYLTASLLALCAQMNSALVIENTHLQRRQDQPAFTLTLVDPTTGLDVPGDGQGDSPPSLVKRIAGYSRPIGCTPAQARGGFDDFETSWCARATSPQQYLVRCSNGMSPITAEGSCNPNEVCVDGVNSIENPRSGRAYCVSTQNFVKLASAQYGGQQRGVRITPVDKSLTKDMLEVVVTGVNGITDNFNAAHLKLEAQDSGRHTLPVAQATDQCDTCASIGIQPWPQGTDSFLATVTLPNMNDDAFLYITEVAG